MNAFLVDLENQPGRLADVAEALGAKGIPTRVDPWGTDLCFCENGTLYT